MCDGAGDYTAALEGLQRTAQAMRAGGGRPIAGAAVAAALPLLRQVSDLVELEFATLAGQLEESGHWEQEGAAIPEDWIRHHCRMSRADANAAITVARQAGELGASTAAVEEGRIGYGHLKVLARTAAAVGRDAHGGPTLFDEQDLLPLAEAHSVSRFRYDADHYRHAADAQGALQAQVEAVERRYLELHPLDEETVTVHGLVDRVGAGTLQTALEPLARRQDGGDHRRRSRRLADALVELSQHVLDEGSLPRRGSQRPQLQVTTSLETLQGLRGAPAAEMELAGPVPTAVVRRLACDAAVVRIVRDAESAVVDVGRARRTAPPATLRALRARDEGCGWPGCDRSVTWTTAHHVEEWVADNGP